MTHAVPSQTTMPDRADVLLGPTNVGWSPTLERLLERSCVLELSASRSAFIKRLRSLPPRVIVLYATDELGTPSEPLIHLCARYCPASQVVYVHPGPAMKLPSAWTTGARPVRFVILDGKSRRLDASRIAEQVTDAIGETPLSGRR